MKAADFRHGRGAGVGHDHPPIDEIREIRRRLWARFDDDPARVVDYLIGLQGRHPERLIEPKNERKSSPRDASADAGSPAA